MAALENLDPAVRIESILDGQDIEPATRIEYFLKKAAEGGGSCGCLVEIKNVEPFQVPDLVNGGTRLFDPENDQLYYMTDPDGRYQVVDRHFYVSNDTPPGIVKTATPGGEATAITTVWYEKQAYDKSFTQTPKFCIKQSTFYEFESNAAGGYIIKPESIVYRNTDLFS